AHMPLAGAWAVGQAVPAVMAGEALAVHELLAPPGAASQATTSYVPARAAAGVAAMPQITSPSATSSRCGRRRAQAVTTCTPFGCESSSLTVGGKPCTLPVSPPSRRDCADDRPVVKPGGSETACRRGIGNPRPGGAAAPPGGSATCRQSARLQTQRKPA